MRIAYVTAHLPPDFTSGATLLVERLAIEAAHRGHDVEVFSGAINQGLADGEVRIERPSDARPFGVHWIGTADRIDQDVDGNWDNPLAAAAVRTWLDGFRPDVIHLHTLQTLGIGVVETATAVAATSGAITVVTMHDLWWWCARLFLVDTELQPCPLVTDVDTCACARSAVWRRERAERLRLVLDRVDRVLAPSSALRDVIVANGVHPDRVTVDENHVADDVAASVADRSTHAAAAADHSTTRFLYLGGASVLKGAGVIVEASRRLDAIGDWELSAYGLEPDGALPVPGQVQVRAAFDAIDVVEVMAAHDVLVLPSLARESFSIAAREALAAGLAVITSDCLGPEEVVDDGVNGIVVPTGDAGALAGAMRSLVDDRELLASLRAGATTNPVSLRTAAEHLTALLQIYDDRTPVATPARRMVGFVVGDDGEPARYRVHHAREALSLLGDEPGPIAHHLDPALAAIMAGCDVVVVQQAPSGEALSDSIRSWRADGALVLFDAADLTADLAASPIAACDGVIASTPAVAERVVTFSKVQTVVVPDAVGLVEMQLAELARASAIDRIPAPPLRVAYVSGMASGQPDLDLIEPVLLQILERHRHIEFVVVGPCTPGPTLMRFGSRVRQVEAPPWRDLSSILIGVDINVAPAAPGALGGGDLHRSWLAASLVGVVTVASGPPGSSSPSGIRHGRTGLVCSSLDEWVAALDELIDDQALRARLGGGARRVLDLHHSPHLSAVRYAEAFDTFDRRRAVPRPPARASQRVIIDDDSRSAVGLVSYDLGDAVVGDAVVAPAEGPDGARGGLVGRLGSKVRRRGAAAIRRIGSH